MDNLEFSARVDVESMFNALTPSQQYRFLVKMMKLRQSWDREAILLESVPAHEIMSIAKQLKSVSHI